MLQLQLLWRLLIPFCIPVPLVSCELRPAGKTI